MNTIERYSRDYDTYEHFYNQLRAMRDDINQEISRSVIADENSNKARMLLKLKDCISNAIRVSGEAMYEAVRIMGQELAFMKGGDEFER